MYGYLQKVKINVSNAKRNMPKVSKSLKSKICGFDGITKVKYKYQYNDSNQLVKKTNARVWGDNNRVFQIDNTRSLMDEKYGKGNYPKEPGSEYNRIRKWVERGFG